MEYLKIMDFDENGHTTLRIGNNIFVNLLNHMAENMD